MKVLLVRHCEAAPGSPDELRPLTAAGRAAARELGTRLATERPAAVLCSPLLRARETAEAIARPSELQAEPDDRLAPGADVDDVRSAATGRGEPVVLVGHQPDLGEIVLAVTGREVPFVPGAVVEADL